MGKYQKESTILAIILIVTEVLVLFMYGFFIRVGTPAAGDVVGNFPWLQDVVVMILIGFGYLMTFMKHYGWSALGYTFLITAVGVQHYLLWQGFWKMVFIPGHEAGHVISIGLPQMIQAFFSVGSCLISTGALLGRTHPLDLIIMVILEMIPYTLVEILIFNVLGLQDAGGSMNIHMFGAYFGIAVSTILGKRHSYGDNLPTVSYNSGIFAMIGTLFLWIYWPSFNSALISHLMVYQKQLAIINTFLSLTSSVIATYVTSIFLRGKFGIDEILNGTLSGGVIIGSSCNLITNPVGAIAIGLFGGALTTFGFIKLSGWLTKVGIYDVCGVHNLHGLPGFFGGIFGAIFLGAYSTSGTSNILGPVGWISDNYLVRGGYQMAGVAVSLGIAIVSGIIVGFILWLAFKMQQSDFFNDDIMWQIQQQHQHAKSHPTVSPVYDMKPMKIDTFQSNVQLGNKNV